MSYDIGENIAKYVNVKKYVLRSFIDKNKLDWNILCTNPNAIDLLEENVDKINWNALSTNPNAITLLEKNIDKINWKGLSYNINAISLLEKNQDKMLYIFLKII